MKKKIFILIALMLISCVTAYAANPGNITVKIDGKTIQFDTPPAIINGRTLVPVSVIAENLGAEASWNAETEEVTITGADATTHLFIGEKEALRVQQGLEKTVTLEVPAMIINGRTMVPIRFIAETFGCDVNWNGAENTVNISTTKSGNTASDAPIEGTTLGNIVKDLTADPNDYDAYFTPAYRNGTIGQCTWYAANRFTEVNNSAIPPRMAIAKEWLDAAESYPNLRVITDIYDVRANSVAVSRNTVNPDALGHVIFIEYVEYDASGNPAYIYFTDANGVTTGTYNQFDYGYDGIVQKITFDELVSSNNMELLGYIVPN